MPFLNSFRPHVAVIVVNTVADSITEQTDSNGSIQVNQYLYAYSYHQFYGANIGNGWFWRADAGLARILQHTNIPGIKNETSYSDWGIGFLGGGGHSWPNGKDSRVLLGGYAQLE